MILPIPVLPEKTDEHAVKFIDLKEYADFFVDLSEKGLSHARRSASPFCETHSQWRWQRRSVAVQARGRQKFAAFRPRSYPRSPISNGWTSGSGSPKKSGTICRNTECTASLVFRVKPGEKRIHPMVVQEFLRESQAVVLSDSSHSRWQGSRHGPLRPRLVLSGERG